MSEGGDNGADGDLFTFGRALAKERGEPRYWRPPCPRCGAVVYRVNRGDCYRCRQEKRPSLELIRRAVWRAIDGRRFSGELAFVIGTDSGGFLAWLKAGCERLSVSLADYGVTWQVYHRQPLRDFELSQTGALRRANHLGNLEVRRPHNAARKQSRKEGRQP